MAEKSLSSSFVSRVLIVLGSFLFFVGTIALAFAYLWPLEYWWMANIIQIAPLWILLIPAFFLTVFSLIIHGKISVLLNIVSVCIIIFAVMGYKLNSSGVVGSENSANSVRVMSINLGEDINLTMFAQYVASINPDVVLVQEVDQRVREFLTQTLAPSKWNIYYKGHLGIISRHPILEKEIRDRREFNNWGGYIGRYIVDLPIGAVNFYGVHFESPREGVGEVMHKKIHGIPEMKRVTLLQEAEMQAALKWIQQDENIIIAGDFNMLQTNPIYYRYWHRFTNGFGKKGFGFGYTKHTRWHGVRIDHILSDNSWKPIRSEVGPDLNGDHRPIFVDYIYIGKKSTAEPS